MKRSTLKWLSPLGLLVLAACSEASDEDWTQSSEDSALEALGAEVTTETTSVVERAEIPVSLPRMAYIFDYRFRLSGQEIAPLQQRHVEMCEALGPYACQIVSLDRTGDEEAISGALHLKVASDKARIFATSLSDTAVASGAEAIAANIRGEDLAKSIVDTEARLRSRVALRDRLMEALRTRKGTVQELVQAERGVAQVNEEIDQAQSWLNEQRGRTAFSQIKIAYESAVPGGAFLAPIKGAWGALGGVLGSMIAILIILGAIGGPLALAVLGIRKLRRRFEPVEAEA
ncbi:MAG TPA: DUF4349 domain-containing protein [Croceibacterium sp.]|nr:DUF4349 domain-containing protein [Croceibacterium sp.]